MEPHPSLPLIATSGLEHSVKVWSPTAPRALLDADAVRSFLGEHSPSKKTSATASAGLHVDPGAGTGSSRSSEPVGPTGPTGSTGPRGAPGRPRKPRLSGGAHEESSSFTSEYTRFVPDKRAAGATGTALEEAEMAAWERASKGALQELRRQILRNTRTRANVGDGDEDHGDLLYFLMRHLRRSALAVLTPCKTLNRNA